MGLVILFPVVVISPAGLIWQSYSPQFGKLVWIGWRVYVQLWSPLLLTNTCVFERVVLLI
jgi:hypothetical protein